MRQEQTSTRKISYMSKRFPIKTENCFSNFHCNKISKYKVFTTQMFQHDKNGFENAKNLCLLCYLYSGRTSLKWNLLVNGKF